MPPTRPKTPASKARAEADESLRNLPTLEMPAQRHGDASDADVPANQKPTLPDLRRPRVKASASQPICAREPIDVEDVERKLRTSLAPLPPVETRERARVTGLSREEPEDEPPSVRYSNVVARDPARKSLSPSVKSSTPKR